MCATCNYVNVLILLGVLIRRMRCRCPRRAPHQLPPVSGIYLLTYIHRTSYRKIVFGNNNTQEAAITIVFGIVTSIIQLITFLKNSSDFVLLAAIFSMIFGFSTGLCSLLIFSV